MRTYIALFRGINVGGSNVLPMKELVAVLENVGAQNVKTYIQSGNAVFQSEETDASLLSNTISAAIENSHGFEPQVFLLGLEEAQRAVGSNPFPEAESEPKTLHVLLLPSVPRNPDLDALENIKSEDLPGGYLTGGIERGERYHVPGNMFWVHPETFRGLLDAYEAMRRRGFRAIVVLSGHWSIEHNIAAIRETGEAFGRRHRGVGWLQLTDQEVVADLCYPVEHAAGGETSLLMAIRPDLVALDKAFETDRSLRSCYAQEPAHLRRRRETPHKYIGVNTAVADGSNDPEGATIERGRVLLERPSSNAWLRERGRS